LAVVGTGHLGSIHARLAAANPQFRLVAVVDPLPAARDALAAELKTAACDDHESVIGNIDAAILATPTRYHHRVAKQLIAAGIHLLIEKPLASTVAEADELVEVARRQQCVLQVGHVERFNPALAAAGEHLEGPRYIEARRYSGHSFRSTDIGVVLDLMIHDLDVVLSLVSGPLVEVSAVGLTVLGPHEDVATARLVFGDGCIAQLSASRISYQARREMQIWTPRGFVGLDFATGTATMVRPSDAVRRGEIAVDGLSPAARQDMKDRLFTDLLPMTTVTAPKCNAIAEEQADFAQAILAGRAPRVPGEQGRAALAAAEAVLSAIAHHARQSSTVAPSILPGPHWSQAPAYPQRQAG
jgi:predicted dehydrogenase